MLPVSNRGIDMKSLKLLLRFLTVGGLVLLLLIPLLMIRGVIQDRERYRAMAEVRVSQSMAGAQQVVGPLRVVPWREERLVNALNEDGKPEVRRDVKEGYLLQSPATLAVDGHLQPGERRIGLYTVNVYEWKAAMKAGFAPLQLPQADGRIYGQPYVVVGMADVRGLVGTPSLLVDGVPRTLAAGTGTSCSSTGVVDDPWRPSLCSSLPELTPVKLRSTRNAVNCSPSTLRLPTYLLTVTPG